MGRSLRIGTFIRANLLNNPVASCSLINIDFLPSQTSQFDLNIILPLVFIYSLNYHLSLEFLVSSFISSYSFSTLFVKTHSSWQIFESNKALEIKTFLLFKLDFVNSTILSCFFFFFLIIHLYFLIPAVITQISDPIAKPKIPTELPIKEAKAETHSVKQVSFQYNSKPYQLFYVPYSSIHFVLFLQ